MESINMAGDWNDLTAEERYELELQFQEGYEWDKAHGWYDDYPDENSPEEQAWSEYEIEEEQFKCEAVAFYKKYLEFKGDKKPSPELLSIFKYNIPLLNYFLNRIKDKKGVEIICEFQAIMVLQKDKTNKLVDDGRKLEPLRCALMNLGFVTKSKQNWSDGFGNKHEKKVGRVVEEYRIFLERNR